PLAVELLRAAVTGPVRADHEATVLACRLADALYRTGDAAEAERIAARTASVVTDPELMVDLLWTLTQCRLLNGRSAESLVELERSLEVEDIDARHHARLLVLTARTQRDLGMVDSALESANRALTEAELVDDRWAVGWALHVLIIGSIMRGDVRSALPLFERALSVTERDATLVDLRMLVQINHAAALGDLDQYEQAISAAAEVREVAERMGSLIRLAQSHSALTELYFEVGRWDESLAEIRAIDDHMKDPSIACCAHGIAAVVAFHRGNAELAGRHLSQAAPTSRLMGNRVVGPLALARSLGHELSGQLDQALASLTDCLTAGAEELDEMEDLLPDAVRLAVQLDDTSVAAELANSAEELARRSRVPHRTAAVHHIRGLINRSADELLLAARYYREAGRPLPRAKALEAAAIMLAERGASSDARTAFVAAEDIYTALGASWDIARLAAALQRHGVPRPAVIEPAETAAQTPYEFLLQKVQEPLP
ncbi:MAG TPA: hypothetical protein VNQ53_11335, partial [Nocardioides sp.]|nr:hypothetical protein [Nocardioides sp.]